MMLLQQCARAWLRCTGRCSCHLVRAQIPPLRSSPVRRRHLCRYKGPHHVGRAAARPCMHASAAACGQCKSHEIAAAPEHSHCPTCVHVRFIAQCWGKRGCKCSCAAVYSHQVALRAAGHSLPADKCCSMHFKHAPWCDKVHHALGVKLMDDELKMRSSGAGGAVAGLDDPTRLCSPS